MMERTLFFLVTLPIFSGALFLLFREQRARVRFTQLVLLVGLVFSLFVFFRRPNELVVNLIGSYNLYLGINRLSGVILIFVNLFGFLICLYCRDYSLLKNKRIYFSLLLWLIAFSNLACLAADFIIFIFAWGALLTLLYAFLNLNTAGNNPDSLKSRPSDSANKALVVVGFGDFSLLLGICLYVYTIGTTQMPGVASVMLNNPLNWCSFLLMLCGAFAKAGCGPLHTWIPAAAETAPGPVMAILPASLDKLLGIYLLARICVDFFVLNDSAMAILLLIGASTIMFAVIMALVQHDLRKLLSFHAISQVGYMVLGFGTGVPIGIAGGLFHMINHALYKSGLFLTGSSIGEKKGTFDLAKLGGLATYMPVTFFTGLVFALSISGVPPFNGFASKWLLYQATLIGMFTTENRFLALVFLIALVAAMFGSALTLASFIKFIHAIFLGQEQPSEKKKPEEVSAPMRTAVVVLAGFCIVLGVVPNLFLREFIEPWMSQRVFFLGTWNSAVSFVLVFTGLLLGLLYWASGKDKKVRQDDLFIGGEEPVFGPNFPATEFYRTIEDLPLMKRLYVFLKLESLDLFNILGRLLRSLAYLLYIFVDRMLNLLTYLCGYLVLGFSWAFRKMHTGVLDFYLVWVLCGLLLVIFFLFRSY